MNIEKLLEEIQTLATTYGIKIVGAIIVFVVGRWIALGITKYLRKAMKKGKVDETLIAFTISLSYIAMMAFLIIASLGILGIPTVSFIAVLGAAGLAIGMALQGSLSNFASAVLMIIFKPFKIGDYVEGGVFTVSESWTV